MAPSLFPDGSTQGFGPGSTRFSPTVDGRRLAPPREPIRLSTNTRIVWSSSLRQGEASRNALLFQLPILPLSLLSRSEPSFQLLLVPHARLINLTLLLPRAASPFFSRDALFFLFLTSRPLIIHSSGVGPPAVPLEVGLSACLDVQLACHCFKDVIPPVIAHLEIQKHRENVTGNYKLGEIILNPHLIKTAPPPMW